MWELNRQNHGLLQRFLGALQAGNVRPLDVRFFHNNGTLQLGLQLLLLRIIRVGIGTITVVLATAFAVLRAAAATVLDGLLFALL